MKKIIIFVVVGFVMFGIGLGVGLTIGRTMAGQQEGSGAVDASVPEPGPVVAIGEFTSNLAGSGRHVISFTVSLEALNQQSSDVIASPGWLLRVKNEVLMIVKDKVYEDLTSAEGALQFGEEIKRALNAHLPRVNGEPPVVRVLFETFVLQ